MRAKIGLLALAMVMAVSSGFAAEGLQWWANPWSESFRSASTASLLEDDFDLMLDPARLSSIEGYRLYTNLSNQVYKNDEVFDDNSYGYYLLGGSGKLFELGHAGLLYDRYHYSYTDTQSVSQSGYQDLDANGTYDRLTVGEQTYNDQYRFSESHWWLGYGRDMGPGKFGVLFYHQAENTTARPWGDNFTQHQSVTDLLTNHVINDLTTTSTYLEKVDRSVNGGALSYWMPMGEQIDLGLAGGINIYLANRYDTLTYASRSYNPSVASTNGSTIDSTALWDIIPNDHVGLEINLRGSMVYKWNENVRTRTDLMFTTLSGERSDGMMTSDYSRIDAFAVPTGTVSTVTTRTSGSDAVFQDNHNMGLMLGSKTTAKLGEKVEMAVGLGFGTNRRDYSMEYTSPYVERIVYNDGDPVTYNDYVQITEGSHSVNHVYTEATKMIVAPVAVEFHITEPFVFRLGAFPSFSFYDATETYHTEDLPNKVTYIDVINNTTSDTTETIPATYAPYNGASYSGKYAESYVNYTYGAGWKISENLQIDLMGFSQLTDLTNWKLSAVFKF
jgi:hypothetical protein